MFFHSYCQLFPALYICKNLSDQLSSIILYLLRYDGVFPSIKPDPSWIVFCLPFEHNLRRSYEHMSHSSCKLPMASIWGWTWSLLGRMIEKAFYTFRPTRRGESASLDTGWVTRFTSVCDELVVGVRGWRETACSFFCCIHMEPSMSVPPRTCGICLASGIIASFLLSLAFHLAPFEMSLKKMKD